MDRLDKLLKILSTPDVFTPLSTILNDVTYENDIFYLNAYCGLSVNDYKKMLREYGIDCWGAKFMDDYITLTVKLEDLANATRILQKFML